MARPLRIGVAGGRHHVTARGKAQRLTLQAPEDKALQKAMAEVMKKIPDVKT